VLANSVAYALYDRSPVSAGHLLIIPRRHVADWFDMTVEELQAILVLTRKARDLLISERHPDGFNLGVNVGSFAGQTVFHAHLHLIPRYRGDIEDPRGGVRAVLQRST
jgi:diadenosine tetraphosphate (Ap4A) HIT family hydrolase